MKKKIFAVLRTGFESLSLKTLAIIKQVLLKNKNCCFFFVWINVVLHFVKAGLYNRNRNTLLKIFYSKKIMLVINLP